MSLEAQPITLKEAKLYVQRHHHASSPPPGWKFGLAARAADEIVGVVMVGRPVARVLDDGWTAEVSRVCTSGYHNACSFLYARARKAAHALGYKRVITYTLSEESGSTLKADGWEDMYETSGGSWDCPSRPRNDKHDTQRKRLWLAPGSIWETPGDLLEVEEQKDPFPTPLFEEAG